MSFIRNRWAYLRLRFDGPYVRVRARDHSGKRFDAGWSWYPSDEAMPAALRPIARHLRALTRDLPLARAGAGHDEPVPLAVYLDLPDGLWQDADSFGGLTRLQNSLCDIELSARVQFVVFSGSLESRRPPFALPFDILAAGDEAIETASALRAYRWTADPVVRKHGFAITDLPETDPVALEAALRSGLRDIVIGSNLAAVLEACRSVPLHRRPRLVISLESVAQRLGRADVPAGTALLQLRGGSNLRVALTELLLGLVHDLPLHEAAHAAARVAPAGTLRLFADPHTNHSLRMRDALIAMQRSVERLERRLPLRTVTPVELAPDLDVVKLIAELRAARSWPADLAAFRSEGDGLVPLSYGSDHLARLDQTLASALNLYQSAADDLGLTHVPEDRVIDIALQRIDTAPMLTALRPGAVLAAEALYRLRVHAGVRSDESMVIDPPPEIDRLLPPADDGHLLEVVVQAKRFGLESPRQQTLRLPIHGGSEPVYFIVRAPVDLGPASLRVHVYYQTHLIQSFELVAEVAANEQAESWNATGITLVYSRVDRLGLNDVQPRRFSLAINRTGSATHDLVLKGAGKAGELTLNPVTFDPQVARFRELLDRASRDERDPAVARDYPRLTPGELPGTAVADWIRSFASHGRELYTAIFTKVDRGAPELRDDLRALQDMRDQKIQVVRLDDTFVFPWALLYDFELPDPVATAPVCLGVTADPDGVSRPCGHTRTSPVVCVNGFWGVRHFIEELLGRGSDTAASVSRAAAGAVRLVCDSRLPGAATLHDSLTVSIGPPHVAVGPVAEQTLLDLLWQEPAARPSILVVLGHMEAPPTARVVLAPTEFLTQRRLADRTLSAARWAQPRPIVLLMACESAATNTTTVNDFVSVLYTAGAAAIVGTEAVVSGDFAADAGRRLTESLWRDASLGEAMTMLRRELLAEGNPLAFLFHAVGNVDLTITGSN